MASSKEDKVKSLKIDKERLKALNTPRELLDKLADGFVDAIKKGDDTFVNATKFDLRTISFLANELAEITTIPESRRPSDLEVACARISGVIDGKLDYYGEYNYKFFYFGVKELLNRPFIKHFEFISGNDINYLSARIHERLYDDEFVQYILKSSEKEELAKDEQSNIPENKSGKPLRAPAKMPFPPHGADQEETQPRKKKSAHRRPEDLPHPDLPASHELNKPLKQYLLRLPPEEAEAIDEAAKSAGMSRSAWIRMIAKQKIEPSLK